MKLLRYTFAAVVLLTCQACSHCSEETLAVANYPDSRVPWKAELKVTGCDATTPFVTSVILFNEGSPSGIPVLSVRGKPRLEIAWSNDSRVIITALDDVLLNTDVHTQMLRYENIGIIYAGRFSQPTDSEKSLAR